MKTSTGRMATLVALVVALTATVADARQFGTVRPPSAGEHGPLSSADRNRDGSVTAAEWEDFMHDGSYRRYGLVQYFDMLDLNHDGYLDRAERARAQPAAKNSASPAGSSVTATGSSQANFSASTRNASPIQ